MTERYKKIRGVFIRNEYSKNQMYVFDSGLIRLALKNGLENKKRFIFISLMNSKSGSMHYSYRITYGAAPPRNARFLYHNNVTFDQLLDTLSEEAPNYILEHIIFNLEKFN